MEVKSIIFIKFTPNYHKTKPHRHFRDDAENIILKFSNVTINIKNPLDI